MLWYFMNNIGDLIEIGKFEISSETLHCCSRKVLGNIELLRKEYKNNNEADFSGSALFLIFIPLNVSIQTNSKVNAIIK